MRSSHPCGARKREPRIWEEQADASIASGGGGGQQNPKRALAVPGSRIPDELRLATPTLTQSGGHW
ncbi:MAG: hypothetical protein QM784_19190, partial [Polyangiaceae bacterium]